MTKLVCSNIVQTRRGRTRRLAKWVMGVGLLMFGMSFAGVRPGLLGFPLLVGGLATLLRQRTFPINIPHYGGSPGAVTMSEHAITLDVAPPIEIPRGQLAQGWIAPTPAGPNVMLETKDGDAYALEVASIEEAEALLEAAGVSAERRVVTMRLAPPTQNAWLGCLVFVLAIFATPIFVALAMQLAGVIAKPSIDALLTILPFILFAIAVVELSTPPLLTVGLDGLRLRSLLRSRYIPHAKIRDLEGTKSGLTLLLDGNKRLDLRALGTHGRANNAEGLRALLRRALSTSFRHKSSSRAAEGLDRRGEPFEAWTARLTKLTSSLGYREGTLDAEALADVVDDAQSPVDRRLGAAMALVKSGDAGKARVRIAAEATADVDLRAALEAAAEEELTDAIATLVITSRR